MIFELYFHDLLIKFFCVFFISVVQFHPDISRLQIFGATDNIIRAWDLNTSQVVATFENGHFSQVTSLQFTANGNHMFRLVAFLSG